MRKDSELVLSQSEVGHDKNDVEEENILCHSHNFLNLEIIRKRKKFVKLYYHQDLSIYYIFMLRTLS
jgi:hypothetical protein